LKKTNTQNICRILPAEISAISSAVLLLVISNLYSLSIYYPNIDTLIFISYHYLGPLIPAIAIPILFLNKNKFLTSNTYLIPNNHTIRNTLALGVTVFAHFNLKLWSQLINPQRYDTNYQIIDESWPQLLAFIEGLGNTMRSNLSLLPHAYHEIFIAMFFVSFMAHGLGTRKHVFSELVGAISFVLLLGGLSYSIAPALGPFIFDRSDNQIADQIQQNMLNFYSGFVETNGKTYSPEFFVAALAAMPSLHLAHSLVFGYFAFKHTRYLGWIYVLPICFIACEAISSKWHYLLDLAAGVLIALLSINLASKMLRLEKNNLTI
jgi:hypothetical protein